MLRRIFVTAAAATAVSLLMPGHGFAQTSAGTATPGSQTRDMVITRSFDAPVARVWQAWTDADDVKRWWGPEGFTAPVAEMDVRVGGTSLVCMRSPEGQTLCNTWTYTKVEPLRRLEFIQHFADEDGKRIAPADVGLPPEIPKEVPHIITFETLPDDRTELTVTEQGYTVDWIVDLSAAGMNQVLDKMAALFAEEKATAHA
jgi:uncharacterized protein YndB with AHSA1/START domain